MHPFAVKMDAFVGDYDRPMDLFGRARMMVSRTAPESLIVMTDRVFFWRCFWAQGGYFCRVCR